MHDDPTFSSIDHATAARHCGSHCAFAGLVCWRSARPETASGDAGRRRRPALASETAPDESEIERFCSNIADAARDRRYACRRRN